jgi:hypothetical protein
VSTTLAGVPKEGILLGLMRRLSELKFFTRSANAPDSWHTIGWWEVRRIPYNILVGTTGIISVGLCLVTGILCEHVIGNPIGIPDPPFFALLAAAAYGLMANLCYTGGWIAELFVRKIWPEQSSAFGRISFFLGLMFSILLTLVPGIVVSTIGAISLLTHFVRK